MAQPALLVDCLKIITWLQQRKKLPKDWYQFEKAAEQKLRALTKDPHQYTDTGIDSIPAYLKQHTENFHYGDMVHIVNLLLTCRWAEQKNMVFGYSHPVLKQWVQLRKFMQNKQVHLVNLAKFITQGLSFDLPSLDKNIELLDSQIANLRRKIDFNSNVVYQQERESATERVKIGIRGEGSVAAQVPGLIAEVPALFVAVELKLRSLGKFYEIYLKVCGSADIKDNNLLAVMEHLVRNGNDLVSNYSKKAAEPTIVDQQQKYKNFAEWKPYNQWGIEIEGGSSSSQSAINYQTLLQSRSTRLQLIEQLNQLLYFFQGVKYMQNLKTSNVSVESENVVNLVESEIAQACKLIEEILQLLNNDIKTRVELKNNSKAYQILLARFRNYEQNIDHIRRQNQEYARQIEEMTVKRESYVKDLRKLRARLVVAKNQCQKCLTDFIKRQIRITGEINKLE